MAPLQPEVARYSLLLDELTVKSWETQGQVLWWI